MSKKSCRELYADRVAYFEEHKVPYIGIFWTRQDGCSGYTIEQIADTRQNERHIRRLLSAARKLERGGARIETQIVTFYEPT